MNKNILIILLGIITNGGFLLVIKILIGEKLEIIYKIDPALLGLSIVIYIILTLCLAFSLNKIFDIRKQVVYYYSLIILFFVSFGNILLTFFKSSFNFLFLQKDIIYETKFIKIRYKYTFQELYEKIDNIYINNKGISILKPEQKLILAEKSKDIENLTKNIVEFIKKEKEEKAKMLELDLIFEKGVEYFKNITFFFATHPYITMFIIGGIGIGIFSISFYSYRNFTEIKENYLLLKETLINGGINGGDVASNLQKLNEVTQQLTINDAQNAGAITKINENIIEVGHILKKIGLDEETFIRKVKAALLLNKEDIKILKQEIMKINDTNIASSVVMNTIALAAGYDKLPEFETIKEYLEKLKKAVIKNAIDFKSKEKMSLIEKLRLSEGSSIEEFKEIRFKKENTE